MTTTEMPRTPYGFASGFLFAGIPQAYGRLIEEVARLKGANDYRAHQVARELMEEFRDQDADIEHTEWLLERLDEELAS